MRQSGTFVLALALAWLLVLAEGRGRDGTGPEAGAARSEQLLAAPTGLPAPERTVETCWPAVVRPPFALVAGASAALRARRGVQLLI